MDKLSYISGIIDGEGYVGISKYFHKNKYNGQLEYKPKLSIANTNKELIDFLKANIPHCNITEVNLSKYNPNCKLCYQLNLGNKHLYPFLDSIKDYVIVKKKQIDLVLSFKQYKIGQSMHADDLKDMENIYQKIKELNRRGVKNANKEPELPQFP